MHFASIGPSLFVVMGVLILTACNADYCPKWFMAVIVMGLALAFSLATLGV